jgi:F-type H+-transporting ATPase subunit epsilon
VVSKQFHVELVSVEAKVWSGQAELLVARTTEGELGVLAGHAPMLGQLKEPSRVRVMLGSGDTVAFDVAGGFISVTTEGVTILAENAVPAHGQDPAAALVTGGVPADASH